jgi:hypothetical protein
MTAALVRRREIAVPVDEAPLAVLTSVEQGCERFRITAVERVLRRLLEPERLLEGSCQDTVPPASSLPGCPLH